MDCAARLAEQLGRVDAAFARRQRELLVALGLPVRLPKLDRGKIVAAMMHDKKVRTAGCGWCCPSGWATSSWSMTCPPPRCGRHWSRNGEGDKL